VILNHQKPEWWGDLYEHQDADLDTHSGNTPAPSVRGMLADAVSKDDEEGEEEEQAGHITVRERVRRIVFAPRVPAGDDGPTLTYRGRKALFALSAFGMGWGTGLYTVATGLLNIADQFALPASGIALVAGLGGIAVRRRFGVIVFASSLAFVGVLNAVPYAAGYLIGGAAAITLHGAYRAVRLWIGPHIDAWYWRAVAWLAHIPAVTVTTAVLLHGTH
jgi:hypothetical protein